MISFLDLFLQPQPKDISVYAHPDTVGLSISKGSIRFSVHFTPDHVELLEGFMAELKKIQAKQRADA